MIIQWNDNLLIGFDIIDEGRKSIIDEFEKLYNFMKHGEGHEFYKEFVNFLDIYASHYLEKEESVQIEHKYENFEVHKALHDEFRIKVRKIKEENESKNPTDHDLININIFVREWLINHILVEDKKFMSSKNE